MVRRMGVWKGVLLTWCEQGKRFFELFLVACGMAHVLYMLLLVVLIFSYAIFFGVTGETILTVVGAFIVPVAVLASLPEDEEGGLSIV
jgi:hypothetical protein